MKVALLTNLPRDLDAPRGGVQSTGVALLRAMADCPELDVDAVVVNADVARDCAAPMGRATIHYRRSRPRGVLLGALTDQRRIVRTLIERLAPEVIHACDTSYFKVSRAACPVIYHIQGTIAEDSLFEGLSGRIAAPLWRALESRAERTADAVIVNCMPVAREVRAIRGENVFVCEEPVHADFFSTTRQEVPTRILCVGGLGPLKNCTALVEAASILHGRGVDFEVRFAGDGAESYVAELRKIIGALGLTEKCRLLGRLSRPELVVELSRAAVLAHPSLREHAPAAITEAMVVGVPVVAGRVGGIPDLVEDGRTGLLVDCGSVPQLADRLGELLANPGLRAEMSHRAREVGRRRFHATAAVQRLLDCYAGVLSTPGRAWSAMATV
jgi:glycosyltransferase involved in cell wall biosynthesis